VQQHTNHRRWIFSLAVVILALTIATPALADYIGPKRTVTETGTVCKIILKECEFSTEKDEWRYKTVGSWSCSLESKPWQEYSNNQRACNDTLHTNGYQYWEREDVERTETNTYPPATITGSVQNCTLRNGWCITPPQLSLTGLEPVAGYSIIGIEGTLNGQAFACTNASCSVPLKQGNNNFTYWAVSSFLDTSEMGTSTAKVDSQIPDIAASLTGLTGQNGWHLGSVTLNSSASDATSGLASFTCTRDGTALGSCSSITVNGDGPHTAVLTARDNAGHARTLTQNISIDSQNPVLNASISGTQGSNDWYTSATLNASASDPAPGSGLSIVEYNLDGGNWLTFPASGTLGLPEGSHNVELRAVDKAGRTVSSPTSFSLDSAGPDIDLDSSGTLGLNNWYVTNPTLSASASDNISGLALLEYSLDNSGWADYTTPLRLGDGIHSISMWAHDQAGWVTELNRTYQVDTRPPQIAGSLSGTSGLNGWFISDVTISASASDPLPGSDIEAFAYTLNGSAETAYTGPLVLSDGQHTVQLNARDKAGLFHSIEQTFAIDTTPPSITVDTALPGWVKGTITFNGTAGDSGSGLSSVEISLDGGQTWQGVTGTNIWTQMWNTADGANGIRQVRVRALDQAGLNTEHTVDVAVDNQSPGISLPGSWLQWDAVTLHILDEHSGISEARVEISDPNGRWPTRVIQLDPGQFPLTFKWDRRFADGTIAESGTYDVKVFAADRLGNIADKSAEIHILLDILPPGPTSTPANTPTVPLSTATLISSTAGTPVPLATRTSSATTPGNGVTSTASPGTTQNVVVRVFGTIEPPVQTSPTPIIISTPRVTPTQSNVTSLLQSIFVPDTTKESTTEISLPPSDEFAQPVSKTNFVLWGSAATAAIAAATAYVEEERRKREEEIARQKEQEEREEERREKMKERKIAKMDAQRAQEAAWEEARLEHLRDSLPVHADIKIAREEYEEGVALSIKNSPPVTVSKPAKPSSQDLRAERKDEMVQEEINSYSAEPQEDWKVDYDNYMAQKAREEAARKAQEALAAQSQPKPKSWLDKAWDFVDEHQKEISLGLGIVAGAAVVVMTAGLATPLVTAALLAGGAALAASGAAAVMTVSVNAHFDRPWNENLLANMAIAGGAALAVAGAGFVFKAAAAGVGSYCATHPSICARVEPVFNAMDKVEETWLQGKLAFQTWTGDQAGAAETAFELHSEHMDGGMPGNAVAKELGEQLSDLSQDALSAINKYGDDILPLIVQHGDEALAIIQTYGDDGIALLQKYGDSAINLIDSYGDSAIKVMGAVDPRGAKKLLESLDDDVLDYAMEQGPDAVEALSKWSPADLRLHGPELALRAKKDAEVLDSIKKLTSLGPIDPKKLTAEQKALIDAIAANSTQYADNGQVVLGKWVDISNGFVQTAQDTASIHYNPHPDMWNSLGELGKAQQEEVAWLINKQVIQTGIAKGKPFEYTLNGIPVDAISKEQAALRAIFSGKSDTEVMDILELEYVPIRIKELQELKKAGYEYTFDNVSKSYILVKK